MRIALVWPNGFDAIYVIPISLGYLKSNLPASHEVEIFDCTLSDLNAESDEFKKKLKHFDPDVVGVSCWSPTFHEAVRVLQVAKSLNPEVTTVIGGAHPSSYADKTMDYDVIDYLFSGESELSFPVFIDELQKDDPDWSQVAGLVYRNPGDGTLQKNPMQREKEHLDEIQIPDYDAMHLEQYIDGGYRFNTRYKRNAPIWVTRGCPYRCGFCSAPFQNGKPVRSHSVDYMIKWVKYLYYDKDIKLMNIIDDNFTFHVKYAKKFCRAMIDLGIKDLRFSTPNGIRAQRADPELFRLMKQAGWENIVVAPESGSPSTLDRMQKDQDPEVIIQKIREIREAGLKVHGFFIIGYPGETIEDIRITQNFMRKCRFNMVFINNFQPLPGTPIYDELVKAGEIEDGLLPKNYSDGERVYTPDELKNFNFPYYVLKNYLYIMLAEPSNIFYMLRLISPKMVVKKVLVNTRNIFSPRNVETSEVGPYLSTG
jgi:radical SAM superfamily enzyme YgiQ (UPF0313 family)